MIITRRKVRVKVFQSIFAQMMTGDDPKAVFDQQLRETYVQLKQQEKPIAIEDDAKFLWDLFFLATRHQKEYLQLAAEHLANWDIERVARADQALILMGITEILNIPYVPVKVTINECIEISKEFSTEKSGTFINGVLDALAQKLTAEGRIEKSGRGETGN